MSKTYSIELDGDRVFAVGPAGECVTVEVPPKG